MGEMNRELWILSPTEEVLDTLSLDHVTVEETREIGKPRQIKVTHPIREFPDDEITRYLSIIRQGNKVWWPETPDGDPCLYILNAGISIDPLMNRITFTAEDVSVELTYLPPIEYPTHFADNFTHTYSPEWVTPSGHSSGSVTVNRGRLRVTGGGGGGTYYLYRAFEPGAPFMVTVTHQPYTFTANNCNGGLRLAATSPGPAFGYHFIRGKDSSGNHREWVQYNTGAGWVNIYGPANDDLYQSKVQRAIFDGTTLTFQESADGGKTFNDIVTDNPSGRGITIQGAGVSAYNGFSVYYDNFHLYTPEGFPKTVNTTFMAQVLRGLFTYTAGNGVGSPVVYLGGYLSPMSVLREVEAQTGYEFEFKYSYDATTSPPIQRVATLQTQAGEDKGDVVLDPLQDFIEFVIDEDEEEYYQQAVPIYKEEADPSRLPEKTDAISKYRGLSVAQGGSIPRRVWETRDGHPVTGASTAAPYQKPSGSLAMAGSDTTADYRDVYRWNGVQWEAVSGKTLYVEAQETNPYNLYWEVAGALREKNTPGVKVSGKLKASALQDLETGLRVGDRVRVKLPWSTETMTLRVENTVKSTADLSSFKIELGNRTPTALNKWIGMFKPTQSLSKMR